MQRWVDGLNTAQRVIVTIALGAALYIIGCHVQTWQTCRLRAS